MANSHGFPVEISVCGSDLQSSPEACTFHGVLVVGQGWVEGQCQAKIRNSWGATWPNGQGDGTINVTADQLAALANRARTAAAPDLSFEWIKEYSPDEPQKLIDVLDIAYNEDRATGQVVVENGFLKMWSGKLIRKNGGEIRYQNGVEVSQQSVRLSDGNLYTGTFSTSGYIADGVVTYRNGDTLRYVKGQPYEGKRFDDQTLQSYTLFRQGLPTWAQNLRLSDGTIFTGEVQSSGTSFRPWNGTLWTAQGQRQIVNGYFAN